MNRGAQALSGHMPNRGDQQRIAKELDVDPATVSRAKAGGPAGLDFRRRCKDKLGIELDWWDEPPLDETAPLEPKHPPSEPPAAEQARPSGRRRTGSSDPFGYA